ncbi:MAG: helix-turn-helix domain-containing protein [Peptoniphilus harei]|nr:helix-turn-helix domain-containing protein [Peptoniphilus harei]
MTLLGFKEFYEIYSPKLGIGRDSLRKIVRKKDFPKIQVGNRVKIIEEEIENYFRNSSGLKVN